MELPYKTRLLEAPREKRLRCSDWETDSISDPEEDYGMEIKPHKKELCERCINNLECNTQKKTRKYYH